MIKKNISVEVFDLDMDTESPVLTFRSTNDREKVIVDVTTTKLILKDMAELQEAFDAVKEFGKDNPRTKAE